MSQSIEMAVRMDLTALQSIETAFRTDITVSQPIEIVLGLIILSHNLY